MRTYVPGKKHPCITCGEINAIKGKRCSACSAEAELKKAEMRNAARKAERHAAFAAEPPKFCSEGCGTQIKRRRKICPACAKKKKRKRNNSLHKAIKVKDLPPHRPPKIERAATMTYEERESSDAKQRLLDIQLADRENRRVAASLGLEYQPGKPLASKVKRLSPAEIAAIAGTLTPPKYRKELPHYVL